MKKRLIFAPVIIAIAVISAILLSAWGKPPEENHPIEDNHENAIEEALFFLYEPVTVDFKHPDDIDPGILPPTPENVQIYDVSVKSYDFNPEKTGFVDETAADDEAWCRIKPLTPNMWAYYFEDYHYELRWENGERWNPDFNDVVVVVWRAENEFRIRMKASASTFRNQLWAGGQLVCDNVSAHADEIFVMETIPRLR
ncbi:MAG: hypothetical protein QW567_01360 [Candidatus Hadarchaeales archaeon]